MNQYRALFGTAWRRVTFLVLLLFVGGNLLLLAAAVLGLLIPDSHAWQVALSLLLVLGLLAGLLLWNSAAMQRLRVPSTRVPLWKSALLLGAWLLLGLLLIHLIGLATANIELRAGYWNSQMAAGMRRWFTYSRLIALQQIAIEAGRCIVVPTLLLPFAIETVANGMRRGVFNRALRVVFSATHWLTAVVSLGIVAWLIPVILDWHPAHSITGETVSAAFRLGVAAVLAGLSLLMLLALDAELLNRKDPNTTESPE